MQGPAAHECDVKLEGVGWVRDAARSEQKLAEGPVYFVDLALEGDVAVLVVDCRSLVVLSSNNEFSILRHTLDIDLNPGLSFAALVALGCVISLEERDPIEVPPALVAYGAQANGPVHLQVVDPPQIIAWDLIGSSIRLWHALRAFGDR